MSHAVPPKPRIKLFLEARYRKFVRDLPQTILYCPECKGRGKGKCRHCEGFGKLTKDSVQELISRKVLRAYRSREGKFHGAGREDIDVRMLGSGRPFVFEVVAPKNLAVDLEEVREEILDYGYGRIEITELVPVPRTRVAEIKETKSTKRYGALVEVEAVLEEADVSDLVGRVLDVVQRTPQRVAHRRADIERNRRIVIRDAWFEDGLADDDEITMLGIEIECEHGTYVKEWISSDDGRSSPALADLLDADTRCIALDVLGVEGVYGAARGTTAPRFEDEVPWPPPFTPRDDPWSLP
ncbi:MAG: hypothetical protein KDC95_11405 [Planctomycetes bacterium]|nr:hypothetical protein [Planctomycetota bacterium]